MQREWGLNVGLLDRCDPCKATTSVCYAPALACIVTFIQSNPKVRVNLSGVAFSWLLIADERHKNLQMRTSGSYFGSRGTAVFSKADKKQTCSVKGWAESMLKSWKTPKTVSRYWDLWITVWFHHADREQLSMRVSLIPKPPSKDWFGIDWIPAAVTGSLVWFVWFSHITLAPTLLESCVVTCAHSHIPLRRCKWVTSATVRPEKKALCCCGFPDTWPLTVTTQHTFTPRDVQHRRSAQREWTMTKDRYTHTHTHTR